MSKLSETLEACKKAKAISGGRMLVGVSGGKDSLATLDVCCRTFDHVEGFFMYVVRGLECEEAPVERAAKRYGVKVHYVPHWMLAQYFRDSTLMHPNAFRTNTPTMKLSDVEAAVRKASGIDWIAYGWRKADSITRRVVLKKWGMVYEHTKKFFPLSEWLTKDVVSYLKTQNIPLPKQVGGDGQGVSGFSLAEANLVWLKKHYPNDFKKVLEVFPLAEVMVKHAEIYPTQQSDEVPAILSGQSYKRKYQRRAVQPAPAGQVRPPEAGEEPEEGGSA